MDPRPYHYQYRKPRLANPTYQSGHLYESIYHIGSFAKMNPNIDKINNNFVPSHSQNQLKYNNNNNNGENRYALGYEIGRGKDSRTGRDVEAGRNGGYSQIQMELIKGRERANSGSYGNDKEGAKYKQNFVNQPQKYSNINNYESSRYRQDTNYQDRNNGYTAYLREKQQINNGSRQPRYEPRQKQQKQRQYNNYSAQQQNTNSKMSNNNPPNNMNNNYSPVIDHYQNNQEYQRKQSQSQPRSYSQDTRSASQQQGQQQPLSNYGSRIMRPMPGRGQDFIYQRQQKPYNIISCYPKDAPMNTHRAFPKLTLENKLIEHGQYSAGGNMGSSNLMSNNNPQIRY